MKRNAAALLLAVVIVLIAVGVHHAKSTHLTMPSAKPASSVAPRIGSQAGSAPIFGGYGNLPLSFEPNRGQADGRARFVSHGDGYSLLLTPEGATLALARARGGFNPRAAALQKPEPIERALRNHVADQAVVSMKLLGADRSARIEGLDPLPGTSNYIIGADSSKWHTAIPTYGKVRYGSIYPGIDLVFYGNQRLLEFDLVVAPGADPGRIALRLAGASKLEINATGDVVLHEGGGQVLLRKPTVYQQHGRTRQKINAAYRLTDASTVRVQVGDYDPHRTLVIDPTISYSTFLGGIVAGGRAIAVDLAGNAYVAGQSCCFNDFPVTPSVFQPALNPAGGFDAFVAKLNPAGTALLYSTYLGGSGTDSAFAIAIDSAGDAYVTGFTQSGDFPHTSPMLGPGGGTNGFVTVLNPTGTGLIASGVFGGSAGSYGNGIAVDNANNVYVGGSAGGSDFPTTTDAFCPGCFDGFVMKISPGPVLAYSTLVPAGILAVAADATGNNVYVAGGTNVPGLQVNGSPFAGTNDAFVARIDTTLSGPASVVYATYLGGGGYDVAFGIALSTSNSGGVCAQNCDAYVTGLTTSSDFPVTAGAAQTVFGGSVSAFVARIGASGGTPVYSTYLGENGYSQGSAIAVDSANQAHITGLTSFTQFPAVNALQAFQQPNGKLLVGAANGPSFMQSSFPSSTAGSVGLNAATADPTGALPVYFVGTNRTGVWRSIDGGMNYSQLATIGSGIAALAFSPLVPPFSCAHELYAGGFGLFKSLDDGNTFTTLTNNLPPGLSPIIISVTPSSDCAHSGYVGVGTENGFAFSLDGGLNFTSGGLPNGTVVFTQAYAPDGANFDVYLGTNKGVFASIAGGPFILTALNFGAVFSLAVDPSTNPPIVYAGLLGFGPFASNNHFSSFVSSSIPLLNSTPFSLAVDLSAASSPKPVYAGVIETFGSTGSLWESIDGGQTYTQVPSFPVQPGAVLPLAIVPNPILGNPSTIVAGVFEEVDSIAAVLSADGSTLNFSTVIGGSLPDYGMGIALDGNANAYYVGTTFSPDFPTTAAFQPSFGRSLPGAFENAEVVKLSNTFSAPVPPAVPVIIPNNPVVQQVTINYQTVGNASGQTTVTASNTGPTPPSGFSLGQNNAQPTYLDISTTTSPTGPISICVNYSPSQFSDPALVRLLHFDTAWVDVTNSNDTANQCPPNDTTPGGCLCGLVSHLSPFLIAQAPLAVSVGPVGPIVSGPTPVPSGQIAVAPAMLTFNPHPVGSVSAPQTLTVTNNGLATVHVASLALNRTRSPRPTTASARSRRIRAARRRSSSHRPRPDRHRPRSTSATTRPRTRPRIRRPRR